MTPLQKFMQNDKPRIDSKIFSYFNSFKTFICYNELPNFKIHYTDSREDKSIQYKAQISLYKKPIILEINIAVLKENSEEFKATLVHEFTHLYDYHILNKTYDNNFLRKNFHLYTEYHAVQIEILFCYHIISKITERTDIMKTNLTTMLDLPVKKLNIYKEYCIEYYKNKTPYNFHMIKITYMYACGASAILSELTDRKISFIKFQEPYQDQMQQIIKLLSTVKYNEIPSGELLRKIGDIESQIKIF